MTMRRDPELLRDSLSRRRLLELMGLGGAAVLAGCAPAAQPAARGHPSASAPAGAAPAPSPSPDAPIPIRFSMTSRTAGNWPDYVVAHKGWWAANGIDPDTLITGTT